jgi:hypothetical protein
MGGIQEDLDWVIDNRTIEEKLESQELLNATEYAQLIITEAIKYGLEGDVFVWALKYMKEDPTMSIVEAIKCGFNEWIN